MLALLSGLEWPKLLPHIYEAVVVGSRVKAAREEGTRAFIYGRWYNNSAGWCKWSPPPSHLISGEKILGLYFCVPEILLT